METIIIIAPIVFLVLWSYSDAKSQHKFFVKKNAKNEEINVHSFKRIYLIHLSAYLVAGVIFGIEAGTVGARELLIVAGVSLIIWVIISILWRVILSIYFLKISKSLALNSLKFVIIVQVILGGLLAALMIIPSIL